MKAVGRSPLFRMGLTGVEQLIAPSFPDWGNHTKNKLLTMSISMAIPQGDDSMIETGAGIAAAAAKTTVGTILAAKAAKMVGIMPFVILATGTSPKLNLVRLIEAVLIGALATGGTMYANQQTTAVELKTLADKVEKLEKSMDTMRQDFYVPRFLKEGK